VTEGPRSEPGHDRDDEPVLDAEEARRGVEAEHLRKKVERLQHVLAEKDRTVIELRRALAAQEASLGWQALERLRKLRTRIIDVPVLSHGYWAFRRTVEVLLEEGSRGVLAKARHKVALALRGRSFLVEPRTSSAHDVNAQYRVWLHRAAMDPSAARERTALRERLARFRLTPLVSLLVVLDGADGERLGRTVQSLAAQLYGQWDLCLAHRRPLDAATAAAVARIAASERRVHIARDADAGTAHERALEMASGEFLAFVEAGDELAPEALAEMIVRLNDDPELDLLYSDEDALSASGQRVDPFFKPDWSPDLLLCTDYVARLGIVRARLVRDAGGVRGDLPGGEVYDLMLRLAERTTRIAHVASVLYHRRRADPLPAVPGGHAVNEAERSAIEDALRRRGVDGEVGVIATVPGWPRHYAPRRRAAGAALVSIIIPTRDKHHLLEQSISSLLARTDYPRYEIIVLDNDSTDPAALRYLASLEPPCRLYRWPGVFNFSGINNFGAAQAKGEQLLFLNNDIEVLEPGWLTAMLEHAERPEVGAVGARLLYPDGRIQHAGVVVGVNRAAANAFRLWPGESRGKPRLADVVRDCSAVTAACMMVPRRVFETVGGFDPRLRVALNDVDLCLRIRAQGYRVIYTPFAVLHHYEGATRGRLHPTEDEQRFQERWAAMLDRGDPCYNPNLSDTRDDWSLRL
jgi:O-antigen biosynthesis protein